MALSENLKGALFMAVAMAGFGINDAIIKTVTHELNTGQIILIRGVVSTGLILIACWKLNAFRPLGSLISPAMGYRVVGELGSTITFLYALTTIPLSVASSILQFIPLAVTLGAALFLKEEVGWRRWLAILVGFGGVMLIIRPVPGSFSFASILVLGTVAFAALRDVSTKKLPGHIPTLMVTLAASVATTLMGAVLIVPLGGWQPVSMAVLFKLVLASLFLLVGYQSIIVSMRSGEISFIAPFRYTGLIWSIILGFFMFGEVPTVLMLSGGAIVVLSGIYTFYRENVRKKPLAQQSPPRGPHLG